jgi:hypothetical protein
MTAKSDDAIRVWPIAGVAMAVLGGLLLVVAAFFLAAVVSDQQYSLAEQRVVAGGRGLNAMSRSWEPAPTASVDGLARQRSARD